MANKKRYISISAGPIATTFDRMMTYYKRSPPNGHMTQEPLDNKKY